MKYTSIFNVFLLFFFCIHYYFYSYFPSSMAISFSWEFMFDCIFLCRTITKNIYASRKQMNNIKTNKKSRSWIKRKSFWEPLRVTRFNYISFIKRLHQKATSSTAWKFFFYYFISFTSTNHEPFTKQQREASS